MQRTRRMTTQRFYRRHNEQLERNHGRNRVPRKPEHRLVVAHAKHCRASGPNRESVKEELNANLSQHLLHVIVLPYRYATGENHDVGFQRPLDSNAKLDHIIRRNPQDYWLATGECNLRGQRYSFAIANLKSQVRRVYCNHFVTRGENCHTRFLRYYNTGSTDLRGHSELRITEALSAADYSFSNACLLTFQDVVLARANAALKNDRTAIDLGILLHHYRICAARQRCACHDLYTWARSEGTLKSVAG